jgi:hypothetical protein
MPTACIGILDCDGELVEVIVAREAPRETLSIMSHHIQTLETIYPNRAPYQAVTGSWRRIDE